MEQYGQTLEEVFARVKSGEGGLTDEEAERRLQENGRNALQSGKKRSAVGLFFSQFKDLMTIILVCAAFLSGVLAFVTGDKSELADTGILLFVILLNAVVGFFQQYRADAAIENLKKLSKSTAKVVRGGRVTVIDAEELVIGDVIEVEEGDRIPADCRIIKSNDFRCDESSLTGESKPVKKTQCVVTKAALAERKNTAHLSTFCVKGSARCVVVAVGMDTEMGRIANLLAKETPAPSPLDKTVSRLGKIITVTVLIVAAILFLGGMFAARVNFLQNIMTAVAVAVAAIPEGMGAVVTIILAVGVQRMAKSRAVMRKLSAVQTLGSCSVICSDKTGTLTKNKMTVEEIACNFSLPFEESADTANERRLLRCMRICESVKGSAGFYVGDPTEIALVEYADRRGFEEEFLPLGGVAFTSERKRMSVAARVGGEERLYVKGGADVLLPLCTRIADGEGERPMSALDRSRIIARMSDCSSRALRVLAFAEAPYAGTVREEELTFLGLAAMLDPPKEGAKEAIEACKKAGIRTVMITGDSAETAFAIAKRLGIASAPSEVLTGEELDALGEEYAERAREFSVYARVSPKHKTEIVRALQKKGEVVAMTGDGVNDAPSIKAADIGVAMGSGTDVTKSAADMVITDDDISTVVRAVEEGRNVFFNVKKTISFFLSTNLAEVIAVLVATLLFWQFGFLTSTQLLWINLITDSLPVLALGVEKLDGAMDRPPVSEKEIFSKRSMAHIIFFGCFQAAIVVALFAAGLSAWGNGAASTAAFVALSTLELLHAFNVRKEYGKMTVKEFFTNRALLVTVAVGLALNVLLVTVPVFRTAFSLTPLTLSQWAWTLSASLLVIPAGMIYKAAYRRIQKFKTRERRSPLCESAQ